MPGQARHARAGAAALAVGAFSMIGGVVRVLSVVGGAVRVLSVVGGAVRVLSVVALLVLIPARAEAQVSDLEIARIPEADSLFTESVSAFEAGRFAEAAGEFSRVVSAFPLHRYSTAAAFMEARALYRVGAYQSAGDRFEAFLGQYPGSRYTSEAQRSLRLARDAVASESRQPLTLGIVLSLSEEEASATQAMFNGIRLAVDAHNAAETGRPIRMVFRDIEALGADGAVSSTVDAGAELVIGALFSDQARLAAAAAERLGVVFMAPLATDFQVAEGKQFAFQANPSIPARGRLMARFAVNGLRIKDLGVVAEADRGGISEQMAMAFAEEAEALGARVHLVKMLQGPTDWFRMSSLLSADTLSEVRALYAPIAGDRADRLAGALLSGLDGILGTGQPGSSARVRILGNAEWHNLPIRSQASRYAVTYSNDYFPDPQSTLSQAFERRYRSLTGTAPGRLAIVGYDLTRYLAGFSSFSGSGQIRDALWAAPPYEGLGIRIHFGGDQVNRTMYYHRYRDGRVELLR
jgi:branched-chain amino acid transport system substrate-binding protein